MKKNKKSRDKKVHIQYLKPGGPAMLYGQMPDYILERFIKLSEDVLEKKHTEWNPSLVGRIYDEWKIPELLYKDYKLDTFIDEAIYKYVETNIHEFMQIRNLHYRHKELPKINIQVKRGDGWFNSMKEGEYNPTHIHTNCDISSVWYINDYTGDNIDNKTNKVPPDGCTEFLIKSSPNGAVISQTGQNNPPLISDGIKEISHVTMKPQAGDFVIFPHWLMHTAYPFKGKGRRITSSINYGFRANYISGPKDLYQ
jgi:hypothetical protein